MTKPSTKWITTQVTAVAGWLIAFVQAGYELNTTLVIAAITIVSQAVLSYWLPNTEADLKRQRASRTKRANA